MPELALRAQLRARGLRYRVDYTPLPELRRRVDVAFVRARVAVNVNGCFWHGCTRDRAIPRTNARWWAAKIARNRARDRQTARLLRGAGWHLVRVWEHEPPATAAGRVVRTLNLLTARSVR